MYKFKKNCVAFLAIIMLCVNILPNIFLPAYSKAFAMNSQDGIWYVQNADSRQNITIDNPTETDFTDIPVLIRLDSLNIPNKDGVYFYINEKLLSSEFVSRNESGISTYWVKIPELKANSSETITAYYSSASNTNSASDVWSDKYEIVQHFSKDAVSAYTDSTGNGTITMTGNLSYENDSIGESAVFNGTQKLSYNNKIIGSGAKTFSAAL